MNILKNKYGITICLSLMILLQGCTFGKNKTEEKKVVDYYNTSKTTDRNTRCFDENPTKNYTVEGFGSEGAEADVYFENDSLLKKIYLTVATSNIYTEHQYYFKEGQLDKYIQISNQINLQKSGYIRSDTLEVENNSIKESMDFDEDLFAVAVRIAIEINSCLIVRD